MNEEFKENVIIKLTFEFALKIIDFCDELDGIKKYALSNQLFQVRNLDWSQRPGSTKRRKQS